MYGFSAQGDVRKGIGGKGTPEAPVAWTGASGTGHAESQGGTRSGESEAGTKTATVQTAAERVRQKDAPDWSIRGGMKHGASPRTGSSGGKPGATDWSVRGN